MECRPDASEPSAPSCSTPATGGDFDLIAGNHSARARSPPCSRCATTCWSRRRRRSTRSPPAWRARCPTARPPVRRSRRRSDRIRRRHRHRCWRATRIHAAATRTTTGEHAAHRHAHAGRRSRRVLPLSNTATPNPNDGSSASISPAAWPRSSRRSAPRSADHAAAVLQSAGTTLRMVDDGAGSKVDVELAVRDHDR